MLFKEFEEHLGDSLDNKADGNFNNKGNKKAEIGNLEKLSEDYWLKIIEELWKQSGEIPDPIIIRAEVICRDLQFPSGPYSAIEKPKKGETEEEWKEKVERFETITKYLINKPGRVIDKKTGIISTDFRDLYSKGLPEKLKRVLNSATKEIMKIEYEHRDYVRKKFGDTKDWLEADYPVRYFCLPGGIDLFLRGYVHRPEWQKNHGEFLKKINKQAKVICIEGFVTCPYGESLDLYWSDRYSQQDEGDYGVLMKEAEEAGFSGVFTEIDARDMSKIEMDSLPLPFDFYEKFFEYLKRENPSLIRNIKNLEELEKNLIAQSTSPTPLKGIKEREKKVFHKGTCYYSHPYVTKKGETSFEPTYQELGQNLFSDALATVKLHLIAKLMADGYLEKGSIIDYVGAGHTPSKTFFLIYPKYAVEVVLRMVNELMAGKVKELPEIYKVFENPNWGEVIKEICKLTFKKPEKGKLKDVPINFLKTYNIDSKKIIPSDKKIKEIREKIVRLKEK